MKKILVVIIALVAMSSMTGCYGKPAAGEIGVVRNGGPFDNHQIRGCDKKPLTDQCGILDNGSGNSWIGWMSEAHFYPVDSQQRFFKMESTANGTKADGADAPAPTVPTADGVEVTLEGTFYLNTAFNNTPQGVSLLKQFDTQFSTRTFGGEHAYDGNSGWSKFLAAIVEPVVVNNLREVISGVKCSELVSSCALVQNSSLSPQDTKKTAQQIAAQNNQSNIANIQDQVQTGLERDIKATLGKDYFKNIKFNLRLVQLPPKVQDAIDTAQASFAQVSQAQAKLQSASLEARANEQRQAGYKSCPACAQIDMLKAIPSNVTTFAPGGNFAVTK